MLKKMLIHGLIAATVIGGAAAVYASGRGGGDEMGPTVRTDTRTGYITDRAGYAGGKHAYREAKDHDREHDRKYDRYDRDKDHGRKHRDRDDD